MAHRLYLDDTPAKKTKRFKLPKIEGKFGVSFMLGAKEVFIGVAISDVVVETVTKKRLLKTIKGQVKVYNFD